MWVCYSFNQLSICDSEVVEGGKDGRGETGSVKVQFDLRQFALVAFFVLIIEDAIFLRWVSAGHVEVRVEIFRLSSPIQHDARVARIQPGRQWNLAEKGLLRSRQHYTVTDIVGVEPLINRHARIFSSCKLLFQISAREGKLSYKGWPLKYQHLCLGLDQPGFLDVAIADFFIWLDVSTIHGISDICYYRSHGPTRWWRWVTISHQGDFPRSDEGM